MDFRLLGSLEVRVEGAVVRMSAGRLRVLTAALALRAGRVVSVDELRQYLWDDPTAGSPVTVRSYIRRLRAVFADSGRDPVRSAPPGYLLAVKPESVDVLLFDALVKRARKAEGSPDEVSLLERAIGLWWGAPLADIKSPVLRQEVVPALVERRLAATERLMDVRLAKGRHANVVSALTREHPLRERFWFQLVSALHHSGRQAEALAAYREVQGRSPPPRASATPTTSR